MDGENADTLQCFALKKMDGGMDGWIINRLDDGQETADGMIDEL